MTGQMARVQSAATSPLFSLCDGSGCELAFWKDLTPNQLLLVMGVGQSLAPNTSGLGGYP